MGAFLARLRTAREEHDWTLEDLAKRLDLSLATIGHYETDKRRPDEETFVRWIEQLGLDRDATLSEWRKLQAADQVRRILELERTRGEISEDAVEYITESVMRSWKR